FKIKAVLNDTLTFVSTFYEDQKILVNDFKLKEKFVVQLKEKINELDEVVVSSTAEVKEFNLEVYNQEFKNQIKEDFKNNPFEYGSLSNGTLSVDLIKVSNFIVEKIGKLLKKNGEGTDYENIIAI